MRIEEVRQKGREGKKKRREWKRVEAEGMEGMEGMEAKRSGEVGQRERRPSECYGGGKSLGKEEVRMSKFSELCI